jgi:outer membrane protein assembly factor BamD (BamD/ComL family)
MKIAIHAQTFLLFCVLMLFSGCGPYFRSSRRPRNGDPMLAANHLPAKAIRQTDREEALRCKNFYQEQDELDLAAKYLERLLALTADPKSRGELILELADMYMTLGNREKAGKLYRQHKTLYPGSDRITYVLYQEIVALDEDSLPSTKDQTKTKEVIKLAQAFLKEFPQDKTYQEKVALILVKAYLKLLKSELRTAAFYLNKYSYDKNMGALKAAQSRIEYLLKEYVPHLPDTEDLLALKYTFDANSSPSAYQASLEQAVAGLQAYVDSHAEPEGNFLSKALSTLLTTKRVSTRWKKS